MQVIELSNPLNGSIHSRFLTGNSADITQFPPMTEHIIQTNDFETLNFIPSYLVIDDIIFKVVTVVLGDISAIYVTGEKGQIVDFVKDKKIQFVNFTQIQAVGARLNISVKS